MDKLIISEQDIINAICVYHSRKKYVTPEDVEVELIYDDDEGFSAEALVNGQQQILITADIIAALRIWIDEYLNIDPFAASIKLQFNNEEGIIAVIH
ncbi:YxcD family protein [Sporosarcina sp. G11-34]|uniref:YxcD family protein n=1 Tax=Sporosarcina sp. G11-34 TaxID=2849605 RepID=UPI0022A8DBB5|nr:YxcD family protein [Sporosarcina sp. G11-34]MCZ2256948.1 YxcD family protein [Sporosarcina sp. G11-34]